MYKCICMFKHSFSHELVLKSTQLKMTLCPTCTARSPIPPSAPPPSARPPGRGRTRRGAPCTGGCEGTPGSGCGEFEFEKKNCCFSIGEMYIFTMCCSSSARCPWWCRRGRRRSSGKLRPKKGVCCRTKIPKLSQNGQHQQARHSKHPNEIQRRLE